MTLDINTNGSWRTVLREIPVERLDAAKMSAHQLCMIDGAKLRFRLAIAGAVLAYCDRDGWRARGERA